jgi:hypothetical protein
VRKKLEWWEKIKNKRKTHRHHLLHATGSMGMVLVCLGGIEIFFACYLLKSTKSDVLQLLAKLDCQSALTNNVPDRKKEPCN